MVKSDFDDLIAEIEWMFDLIDFEWPEDQITYNLPEDPDGAELELMAIRQSVLYRIQTLSNKFGANIRSIDPIFKKRSCK